MPRNARVKKSSDGIYHVIERGNERKEIFRDDGDRIKFLDIINLNQKRYQFNVYAYCLMSNHVHLLLGCNGCDISQVMKSINISYVIFFNRKYQRCGHLFQDRFRSEFIDTDAYAMEVSRYIHLNPVQAGMVAIEDIAQYPWSSYNQYMNNETQSQLPVVTNLILAMFSNKLAQAIRHYHNYLIREDSETFVWKDELSTILVNPPGIANIRHYENDRQEVVEMVAAEYGVDIKNSKELPMPIRNELILRIRQRSQLTLRQIGEMFGGISESMVSKIIKSLTRSSQEPSP